MFRAMRRSRQQLPDDEIRRILTTADTAILGLCGDSGYPYTVPVNFVYYNDKIYFHCAKQGHKLDALKNSDKVSVCIVDTDEVVSETLSTDYRSVIAFGRAKILDDDDKTAQVAFELGMKYGCGEEKTKAEIINDLSRLCCVEITLEHISGKEGLALSKKRGEAKN